MKNKHCCSYLHCANHLGLFFLILFAICFAWFYINPAEQELHLGLLKLSFIGYTGMNLVSFIFAAVQSYIWGYVISGVFFLGKCCHKDECCGK